MNQTELNKILELHIKWLNDEPDGVKADFSAADLLGSDLRGANLSGANLYGANLRWADLRESDLHGSDLRRADLRESDLQYVDLHCADLQYADLHCADLQYVDLHCADLRGANLRGANLRYAALQDVDLRGANLREADLRRADLSGANLDNVRYSSETAFFAMQCPEKGSYIGYKKAHGLIVELEIPADALRSSATSRKCRASKVNVLSLTNPDGSPANTDSVASNYARSCVYKVGETVEAPNFDTDRWIECSTGIHHFITREEAVQY